MTKQYAYTFHARICLFEICKKSACLKSKLSVALSRVMNFDSVVSVDLNVIGYKYILWMVCIFTNLIRGVVLKSKTTESVVKSLHILLCMDLDFPRAGL